MSQVQDPITILAGVIQPGVLIRSVAEIENYLGMACKKFIETAWIKAQLNPDTLLRAMPSLYFERPVTILQNQRSVDISTTHADIFELLDSRNGATTLLEVWDPARLTGAISLTDPFYVGTARRGGIIFQRPYLWIFPASLAAAANYTFTLCFLRLALNPTSGAYLVSGGDYDIPFDEIYFPEIADIATKLYQVDDYQEDAG